jgi:hypothetical protein
VRECPRGIWLVSKEGLMDLKIIRLSRARFYSDDRKQYIEINDRYCLYSKEHGYFSFKTDNRPGEIKTPFISIDRTKKALQRIIDQQNDIDYSGIEWIPLQNLDTA